MKNFWHTKIGWKLWLFIGWKIRHLIWEKRFYKWLKFAKKNNMWVNITDDYLKMNINKKRTRLTNLFRSFIYWDK